MLYDDAFLQRLEDGLGSRLAGWGFPDGTRLRLLTISENATYLAEAPDGTRHVLRVHRPGYHSEAEILSELAWIEALRDSRTIATPRPVPGRDGRLLQSFDDGETLRHAVCFEHVPGTEPDAESDLPHWFRHLGAIAARLHRQARGFARPEGFVRKHWTFDTIIGPDAYWGDWRAAPGLSTAGRATLERTADRLKALTGAHGTGPDRYGLIHSDMRAANLLVSGDTLTVIDFDDCGFGWFGYDFAASVSFIEDDARLPALMAAWQEGYATVVPLDPAIAAMLPDFVMLRRMQLTAWLASHAETPTAAALGPGFAATTVALAESWLAATETAQ